jgi:hypothetical protein
VKLSLKLDEARPPDAMWRERHASAQGQERLTGSECVSTAEACEFVSADAIKRVACSAPLRQPFALMEHISGHGFRYDPRRLIASQV